MKRLASTLSIALVAVAVLAAQSKTAKPLDIWVVDVEGGKAAIYVSPTGQTAMIDTGFPGARDLDRITAAIADAGIKQIDYLISTHYHVDHVGNLVELSKRIPVGTYVDHGPTVEGPNVPQVEPGPDGLPVTKAREQVEGFQAGVRGALWQGEAPGGQARRSPADHGARLGDCHGCWKGAEDSAPSRRRQAQP